MAPYTVNDPTPLPPLLVLVCKRPGPGVGKQRIAATLGKDLAAALAERLMDCAAEDLAAWPFARAVSIAAQEDAQWAAGLAPDTTVAVQCAGNLGERLADAYRQLTTPGQRLLFIGADAPALDRDYLLRCLAALDDADVVLGDATDGGVVVMGTRSGWPPLAELPWSTSLLADSLHAACSASGLKVVRQPALTDIDHASQLDDLRTLLADDPRPARRALLAWLQAQPAARQLPANQAIA